MGIKRRRNIYAGKWEDGIFRWLVALALALWLATGSIFTGAYVFLGGSILAFIFLIHQGAREAEREKNSGVEKLDEMSPGQALEYISSIFQKTGYKVEKVFPGSESRQADDKPRREQAREPACLLISSGQRSKALVLFYKSGLKQAVIIDENGLKKGPELLKEYQVPRIILSTNGYFDQASANLARRRKWLELWDRRMLVEFFLKARTM